MIILQKIFLSFIIIIGILFCIMMGIGMIEFRKLEKIVTKKGKGSWAGPK